MGLSYNFARELKQILLDPNNHRISKIDLHKNNLADLGVKTLMKAMKRNHTVIHLDVSSNEICNDGMVAIFKAL
jgi:hypothetical protein